MSATFRWIVERRLLTLAGFGVILLGAFIPWPNLAIAAVVIVLGAVLLAVQIPIAMRDATEQLDGVDEPEESEEQWQPPAYPQYQPEPYQQPILSQQPQPSPEVVAPTPVWRPEHIPQSPEAEPSEHARPAHEPGSSRRMYEPAPVWQPKSIPQSSQPEPSSQPGPSRRLDEPALPWRPQNIPPYRPEP